MRYSGRSDSYVAVYMVMAQELPVMKVKKVIYLSDVCELLAEDGWVYEPTENGGGGFRRKRNENIPVFVHLLKPHLVYLGDLINLVPADFRLRLISLAFEEDLSFDVYLKAGQSIDFDVQSLFYCLAELDRAAGGFGVVVREAPGAAVNLNGKFSDIGSVQCTQLQVVPVGVEPKHWRASRRAFMRLAGVYLSGYMRSTVRRREEDSEHTLTKIELESDERITAAANDHMEMEAKRSKIIAGNKAELKAGIIGRISVTAEIRVGIRSFLEALAKIDQSGGCLFFDESQLHYYNNKGRTEFPGDPELTVDLKRYFELVPDEYSREAIKEERRCHLWRQIIDSPKLPSPDKVALEIYRMTKEEGVDYVKLKRIVSQDPAIASRVIQLANSVYYQSRVRIHSLDSAFVRIGMHMLGNVAMGASIVNQNKNGPCQEFDYEAFWSDSIARSVAARHMAIIRNHNVDMDSAFTAGLLCQIGRLAFASVEPVKYAEFLQRTKDQSVSDQLKAQRRIFGIDHNELTAKMMNNWQLPEYYSKAIYYQDSEKVQFELPVDSPELELVRILKWSRTIARLFKKNHGLRRRNLDLAVKATHVLGMPTGYFSKYFDKISSEWLQMGGVFEVPTRQASSWEQIYATAK